MTMSHGTLNSLLGRLSTMFNRIGKRGEWVDILQSGSKFGGGNPCRAIELRDMEQFFRKEQAKASIRQKKAVPFFLDKLQRLMSFLTVKVVSDDLSVFEILLIRSDMTLYTIGHVYGRRGGDIRHIETNSMAFLPNNRVMIFNLDWGKTLRDGSAETFAIERDDEDPIMDPIFQVEALKRAATAANVDMSTGYLFRNHSATGSSEEMMVVSTYTERLKKYLIEMGEFEGETLHSFRSEAALEKAFAGQKMENILSQVGWASEKMAEHYMALEKVLVGTDVSNKSKAQIRQLYQDMNKLTGFLPIF
eukprot:Lithocolla_globosa_v1_NODE_1656_length_2412_cov_443.264831.p1 type:complete len:305 gc:universal NODE_1656_length_2412_cov_443.264831:384-1298(+)